MNASHYHRGGSGQRYPFFISALIIAGGLALFYLMKMFFFGDGGDLAEVKLMVPAENTVYVQFADDEESGYKPVSANSIPFLENESVQSRNTSGSSLVFFDGSQVLLDKKTEVLLGKSRMHKGETREIGIIIKSGRIWVDVAPSLNPRSEFVVELGENEFAKTGNGEFSVDYENEVIKVADGIVRVSKTENGEEVFYTDIGVGQQFSFTGDINQNSLSILAEDPWFSANKQKDVEAVEPPEETSDSADETPDEEGSGDDRAEAPATSDIEILIPGKNGSRIELSEDPIEISGLVPDGTAKVVVDDYTLQKFESGDTSFKYVAATEYENLKEGENIYSVKAYNADGDIISEAVITVFYTPGETDEDTEDTPDANEEETAPEDESSPDAEAIGVLKITAPNEGEDLETDSTDPVILSGTAPSNAAQVTVNGYALSKFAPGDTTWKYFINREYDNMTSGKNLYEVKALDADGKILATDTMTITFPELPEEEAAEDGLVNQWEPSAEEEVEASGEGEVTE